MRGPSVRAWISEDPIGFAAGDANLYRYVGNGATYAVDPTGLEPPINTGTFPTWRELNDKELLGIHLINGQEIAGQCGESAEVIFEAAQALQNRKGIYVGIAGSP